MRYRYFVILALLILLAGCSGSESGNEQPRLLLFCGAGIQKPVSELVETFNRDNDCVIEADYAGSEVLLSRITLKKKGDLYMPGDRSYVDIASESGMIHSSINACYFVPCILVEKGNPKGISSLEDLKRKGIRLGLGDSAACAIGRQSKKIFDKNKIPWKEVENNIAFKSLTVNELGIQIQTGALDAVIVWDAIANQYLEKGEIVEIPPDRNVISTVPVAVLEFSEHRELAQKFAEFAASERGKNVFRKYNYRVSSPEENVDQEI